MYSHSEQGSSTCKSHMHEREREREREIICYIVYDKYSKTFRLLFSKNTLLLPANASRSVDLPQPKGIIIARSSLGGA